MMQKAVNESKGMVMNPSHSSWTSVHDTPAVQGARLSGMRW